MKPEVLKFLGISLIVTGLLILSTTIFQEGNICQQAKDYVVSDDRSTNYEENGVKFACLLHYGTWSISIVSIVGGILFLYKRKYAS